MTLKTSFKKVVSVFVALVFSIFSLFVPLRVSAAYSQDDLDRVTALSDWLYDTGNNALDASGLGEIPIVGGYLSDAGHGILNSIYALWGTDGLADNALNIFQDITNSGNATTIDFTTTQSFSGCYSLDGVSKIGSFYTRDLSNALSNTYFNLYSTEDFSLLFRIVPADGYGPEDYTLSVSNSIGNYQWSGTFTYTFSANIAFIPEYTLYYHGDTVVKRYQPRTSVNHYFSIDASGVPIVYPTGASALLDFLCPTSSTDGSSYLTNSVTALSGNKQFPSYQSVDWPSGNTSVLSPQDLYNTYQYYNNYVTPYFEENYGGDDITYYNVDHYYQIIQDQKTTASVATTSPGSGIIVVDPFTLPPEWVESDVVELETDHYTIPYDDMIDDPFDYLAGLGTYPNPPTPTLNARKRSQTSTVTRAVSVDEGSPPLVWEMADYETKTALTDYFIFAENLLHDTGLYNLVGSLIAVGIIVSLV